MRLAFEALGHQVHRLQENQLTKAMLMDGVLNSDLLLWTGTWERTPGPNYCASTVTLDEALDVHHECAVRGIPTATIHLDVFWGVKRGDRRWWTHPMFQASHVFTASGDHEAEWEALGVNHRWLPPGVRHSATGSGTFQPEFACDVAFTGSHGVNAYHPEWTYRRELVEQLRQMSARNGWVFRNPGGWAPKVDRQHMNDFYASAKVTVGDSLCFKRERSKYWSDRFPETTGRGGFIIAPQIDALSEQYDGKMPMYRWGDWGQLESMIAGYLADDAERERVRKTCHEIAATRHTYMNRVSTVLETIGLV